MDKKKIISLVILIIASILVVWNAVYTTVGIENFMFSHMKNYVEGYIENSIGSLWFAYDYKSSLSWWEAQRAVIYVIYIITSNICIRNLLEKKEK